MKLIHVIVEVEVAIDGSDNECCDAWCKFFVEYRRCGLFDVDLPVRDNEPWILIRHSACIEAERKGKEV